MAELNFYDASVTINAVDLSDHVRSVTINYAADIHDISAMGTASHIKLAGLKDWSVTIEFNQDYAASEVDATLFSLIGAAEFAVSILPTSAAASATNPNFNGNCVLENYQPINGPVGDPAVTSITLQGSGDLTRSTS